MCACPASIARASVAVCAASLAGGLTALRLARLAGGLPAPRLASLAGSTLRLASLASVLTAACPASLAGGLTLRSASIARSAAGIAGTGIALRPAGIPAGGAARAAAAHTSETGLRVSSASARTLGRAGGPACRPDAGRMWRRCRTAQLYIDVKLVGFAGTMRARADLGCGYLGILLDEDPCAAQAAERRLLRRKLLAVDNVLRSNLDIAIHIETEMKQPITFLGAATQQSNKAG
jgi:hypothetical protein